MGCDNSQQDGSAKNGEDQTDDPGVVYNQFKQLNLAELLQEFEFDKDLEEQIFMAINVVRAAPAFFVDKVRAVRRFHELAQKAENTQELLTKLQEMKPLAPVKVNKLANDACKQNNESKQEVKPSAGGNKGIYGQLSQSAVKCEEYTMANYTQDSGAEFVALALILNFGRSTQQSPILNPEVKSIGINVMSHKLTINLIQVLYVKGEQPE